LYVLSKTEITIIKHCLSLYEDEALPVLSNAWFSLRKGDRHLIKVALKSPLNIWFH